MTKVLFLKITQVSDKSHPKFGQYVYEAMFEGREDASAYQYEDGVPDIESIAKFIVEGAEVVGA